MVLKARPRTAVFLSSRCRPRPETCPAGRAARPGRRPPRPLRLPGCTGAERSRATLPRPPAACRRAATKARSPGLSRQPRLPDFMGQTSGRLSAGGTAATAAAVPGPKGLYWSLTTMNTVKFPWPRGPAIGCGRALICGSSLIGQRRQGRVAQSAPRACARALRGLQSCTCLHLLLSRAGLRVRSPGFPRGAARGGQADADSRWGSLHAHQRARMQRSGSACRARGVAVQTCSFQPPRCSRGLQ